METAASHGVGHVAAQLAVGGSGVHIGAASPVAERVDLSAGIPAFQFVCVRVALTDNQAFAKATKLKAAQLKKIRPYITEKDPIAQPLDEPDVDLRDTENIPFTYEGGIDSFIEKEVHPYAPDAYVDEKKTQIGYEISFTKYFYKPVELRDMSEILADLAALDKEADGVLAGIMEGIQ